MFVCKIWKKYLYHETINGYGYSYDLEIVSKTNKKLVLHGKYFDRTGYETEKDDTEGTIDIVIYK